MFGHNLWSLNSLKQSLVRAKLHFHLSDHIQTSCWLYFSKPMFKKLSPTDINCSDPFHRTPLWKLWAVNRSLMGSLCYLQHSECVILLRSTFTGLRGSASVASDFNTAHTLSGNKLSASRVPQHCVTWAQKSLYLWRKEPSENGLFYDTLIKVMYFSWSFVPSRGTCHIENIKTKFSNLK